MSCLEHLLSALVVRLFEGSYIQYILGLGYIGYIGYIFPSKSCLEPLLSALIVCLFEGLLESVLLGCSLCLLHLFSGKRYSSVLSISFVLMSQKWLAEYKIKGRYSLDRLKCRIYINIWWYIVKIIMIIHVMLNIYILINGRYSLDRLQCWVETVHAPECLLGILRRRKSSLKFQKGEFWTP